MPADMAQPELDLVSEPKALAFPSPTVGDQGKNAPDEDRDFIWDGPGDPEPGQLSNFHYTIGVFIIPAPGAISELYVTCAPYTYHISNVGFIGPVHYLVR